MFLSLLFNKTKISAAESGGEKIVSNFKIEENKKI